MMAVAVASSMAWQSAGVEDGGGSLGLLAAFRSSVYECLTARADALFELGDAVLCGPGRVTDLARLSLVPEFGRGHGALYDALNAGHAGFARLRRALAGLPLPAWPDGRIRLAVDVSNWLRPEAETSPERAFCHVAGRGKNAGQRIPGWPYSYVTALGPGPSSWTVPLDAVRLGPADDDGAVTAAQLRDVAGRLAEAGHWAEGDPDIVVVADAGYNLTRLAWLLRDLPVLLAGRVRSDRVFCRPAPPRAPGTDGRRLKHGPPVRCDDPDTWGDPALARDGQRPGQDPVQVTAWHRMHPKVTRRTGGFEDWPDDQDLPVIEGTLIRLSITRQAAGGPHAEPIWLWAAVPDADDDLIRVIWQAYLRRIRPRAHLPVPQAEARLDPAAAARPGRRRPVDLAPARLLRPALARPPPRRDHPAALAAPPAPRHDDSRPRPGRVPPRPRTHRHSRQDSETLHARPRPPQRLKEQAQATQLPDRQDRPQATESQKPAQENRTNRLNGKLGRQRGIPDVVAGAGGTAAGEHRCWSR